MAIAKKRNLIDFGDKQREKNDQRRKTFYYLKNFFSTTTNLIKFCPIPVN